MKSGQIKHFEKELFNNNYDEYSSSINSFYFEKILSAFETNIDYGVCLEAGCGTGTYGLGISKKIKFKKMYGVDISEMMIKKYNSSMNNKKFIGIVGDLEDNNLFESNKFDTVIFHNILHHFPNFEIVIINSLNWLKKDGRIILIEPNGSSIIIKFSEIFRKLMSNILSNKFFINNRLVTPNETNHSSKRYLSFFRKNNIEVISYHFLEYLSKNKFYNFKQNPTMSIILYFYGTFIRLLTKLLNIFLPSFLTKNILIIKAKK